MRAIEANGVLLHVREDGDPTGVPVVFCNSLGTDMRLWDAILPSLPPGLRIIRFDKRGHGLSECPPAPYTMDELASDAEALLAVLDTGPVIWVGLSIGGLIGQRLAHRRPDLFRALVLSNTAAKMGTRQIWDDRIAAIRAGGIIALEASILDRWFGPAFRPTEAARLWGAMVSRTPAEGYIGCAEAIAETDLTETTKTLRLPTFAIAGRHDGAAPPEVVAATAALIPGTPCEVIEGVGHLPCVENASAYAAILTPFLERVASAR